MFAVSWRKIGAGISIGLGIMIAVAALLLVQGGQSARADTPATGSISGTVTLPAGAPAAWMGGVYVSAQTSDGSIYRSASVDASGKYTITGLAAGSYRVQFWAGSYWDQTSSTSVTPNLISEYFDDTTDVSKATPVVLSAGQVKSGVNATLAMGATISGTVTLPAGAPTAWLQSVRVSVDSTGSSSSGGSAWVGLTGKYTITGLAAGSYQVLFSTGDYWDQASSTYVRPNLIAEYFDDTTDRSKATPVVLSAGQVKSGVNATLAMGATINGTVTLPAGAPTAWLQGVHVSASSTGSSSGQGASVDATGKYTITGLAPGSYQVQFSAGSYWDQASSTSTPTNLVDEYFDDTTDSSKATPVVLSAGQAKSGVNATLEMGATISGTVTLPAGAPTAWLQGVQVSADSTGSSSSYGSASVDASGKYTITGLAAGSYRVQFWAGSYWDQASSTSVTPNLISEYFDDTTDSSKATPVVLSASQAKSGVNATLAMGATISGTVTLPAGAPAAWLRGVQVSASSTGSSSASGGASVDASGKYTITGLAAGSYRVQFSVGSYWDQASSTSVTPSLIGEYFDDTTDPSKATPVVLSAGQAKSGVNATLAMGASISGTVTLPAGAPTAWLQGVQVSANVTGSSSSSSSYKSASVDASGKYTITGLAAGSYRVQFSVGSYWDQASSTSVTPNLISEYFDDTTDSSKATPVVLSASQAKSGVNAALAMGATISGTVTLPAGAPTAWMQGVRVSANSTGSSSSYGSASVDASGKYTITGLAPGSYKVRFSASSYWDQASSTSVTPNLISEYFDDTTDSSKATPVVLSAGQAKSGVNATLEMGATISGTVTLPAGAPTAWLQGVHVSTSSTGSSSSYGSASVDASGKYTITGLAAGSYRVQFSVGSYWDQASSAYVTPNLVSEYFDDTTDWSKATPVVLSAGQVKSGVNASLAMGATISGTVTLPAGAPASWLTRVGVVAGTTGSSGGSAMVDASGKYTITGLTAGSYQVSFSSWSYRDPNSGVEVTPNLVDEFYDGVTNPANAKPVSVTAGQAVSNINASLDMGATITGTVTIAPGSDPSLVSYIDVTAVNMDPNSGVTKSSGVNADGSYQIVGLPRGQYQVRFSSGLKYSQEMQDFVPTGLASQFYSGASSAAGATAVAVGAGATVGNINATLAVQSSFTDLAGNAFSTEIGWLAAQGISTGYDGAGGKEYRPYGNVTRDAMAAFLYRYEGSPAFTPPAVSPFVDVPLDNPFYKEITWLASRGITTGWDVGGGMREFRPYAPITRDAMSAFLFRFAQVGAGYQAPSESPFTDVSQTGSSFYREITWLASTGISTGWATGGGKEFRPYANITRDAMAAFLFRYEKRNNGGAG